MGGPRTGQFAFAQPPAPDPIRRRRRPTGRRRRPAKGGPPQAAVSGRRWGGGVAAQEDQRTKAMQIYNSKGAPCLLLLKVKATSQFFGRLRRATFTGKTGFISFSGTCGGLFVKGFFKKSYLFFLDTVRRTCEEATPQHYRSLACARRTSASLSKHLLYCGLIQY